MLTPLNSGDVCLESAVRRVKRVERQVCISVYRYCRRCCNCESRRQAVFEITVVRQENAPFWF